MKQLFKHIGELLESPSLKCQGDCLYCLKLHSKVKPVAIAKTIDSKRAWQQPVRKKYFEWLLPEQ